jgi:hypothetical protein
MPSLTEVPTRGSHRVQQWSAPDEETGTSTVLYCDEPGCPAYGYEIRMGVCFPVGSRIRTVRSRTP